MPEWKLIWIEKLLVSDDIRHKIEIKHGIDVDWLVDRLIQRNLIFGKEVSHPIHGVRTLVRIPFEKELVTVIYLKEIEASHGEWFLITTFFTIAKSKTRRE
jgi:hypothetical protein